MARAKREDLPNAWRENRRVILALSELELPLHHPFTIARGTEDVARSALFRLRWNGHEALGESAPSSRYGESIESVRAYFAEHPLRGDDPYALEALLAEIPPAARCGLDIALHDLIGKDLDRPLWRLLGLDPDATPVTSFTVGIDTPERMLAKLDEIADHPIVKVKLGFAGAARRASTPTRRARPNKLSASSPSWLATTSNSANNRFRRAHPNGCAGSANARACRSSPTKMPAMRAICRRWPVASTAST